jgi:hypothetical protein
MLERPMLDVATVDSTQPPVCRRRVAVLLVLAVQLV